MKVLAISTDALFTGLLDRLKSEGNQIKLFIQNPKMKDVGNGMFEKIDSYEDYLDWADIIVFDDVGFGDLQDKLRNEGKMVIGGSKYFDTLEQDRTKGKEVFKSIGLEVPDFWEFNDFDKAIDFVNENPGRYVIKPYGKTENYKELAYVGMREDGKDVIAILERYKNRYPSSSEHIELEQFINGIEVATSAYFDGEEFVYPININYEHKRFFNNDLGPNTGEQGTLMHWKHGDFKLFEVGLLKLEDKLKQEGYVGVIDINYIVTENTAYPLEFTNRFGYPALFIELEGINNRMSVTEFLLKLVNQDLTIPVPEDEYQIGVVGNMPTYPFECPKIFEELSKDIPIYIPNDLKQNVWLCDAYYNGQYRLTGQVGYPFVVTARGPTIQQTQKLVYDRIYRIRLPNMYYRTDIGEKMKNQIPILEKEGWI